MPKRVLALLLLSLLPALAARADTLGELLRFSFPHMSVNGYAEQDVPPEFAVLTIGVVVRKATADEAVNEAAKASAAAIEALKAAGVDAKDIESEGLGLSPIYDAPGSKTYDPNKHEPIAYSASNDYLVRIRDVKKAGEIVRGVVANGADAYRGLRFGIENERARLDDLRAQAIADAERRAAFLAHAAGMRLGRLVEIDPEPDGAQPVGAFGKAAFAPSGSAVAIPIEPRPINLTAHVVLTFETLPQ